VRRLVLTTFASVDGVMQSPGAPDEDRSGGFEMGGWLVPYVDASTAAFAVEWIQQADGILLGRRSYEMLASYWPHVTDPGDVLARHLNTLPKYVVSTTLTDPAWRPTTVIAGDLVTEIKRARPLARRHGALHDAAAGSVVRGAGRGGRRVPSRVGSRPGR
jgi:dihydrofolate reductase